MGTPPIQMANLGMADSLILMVMALVVFGPRRLPQIGRQIGKLMYEFRKASNDFKFQMEEELRTSEEADRRKKEEERQRTLALAAPAAEPVATVESATPLSDATPLDAALLDSPSGTPIVADDAEATEPRILPPSIGEQVAAARPNSPTAQAANEPTGATSVEAHSAGSAEPGTTNPGVPAETPTDQNAAEPEQAAHHG
ncbi:MAG TPA: twin-arginine translocase TatA/TatE family subunit [Terracidiphilus sp.]